MSPRRRILGALPPFLVGAAGAGVAETSATLLLYSAEGFLPALTLILTVEAGALALGVWSGSLHPEGSPVEQVRRRWLFGLVTLAMAAVFATGMTVLGEGLRGGMGQGFGLAFLGSLPLFALGSLLGSMGRVEPKPSSGLGGPVAAGLAAGFLLSGWLLIPNLAPYTVYLLLLSLLSGGALVHGWTLDGGPQVEILEELPTPRGVARVEERVHVAAGTHWRVILEGGRLRAREGVGGEGGRAWEDAVLAALEGENRDPGAVLFLGGGGGTFCRLLLERFPSVHVVVVEESREVVELARRHFHPFPGLEKVQLLPLSPWESLAKVEGPFPLLLVDLGAVPSLGPVPEISPGICQELSRLAGPQGTVVLGGLAPPERLGEAPVTKLLEASSRHFNRGDLYQGVEESFLLYSRAEAPAWSPALPGFHLAASGEEKSPGTAGNHRTGAGS